MSLSTDCVMWRGANKGEVFCRYFELRVEIFHIIIDDFSKIISYLVHRWLYNS